jgi:hypothetical protein
MAVRLLKFIATDEKTLLGLFQNRTTPSQKEAAFGAMDG